MGDWVGGCGGGKERGAGAGETGGFVEEEGGVMCLEVEEVYTGEGWWLVGIWDGGEGGVGGLVAYRSWGDVVGLRVVGR